jgi:hypothetical protein
VLDETQFRQHLDIVMDAPNIAPDPARELASRHRSLPLQGKAQSPASLRQLAKEAFGGLDIEPRSLVTPRRSAPCCPSRLAAPIAIQRDRQRPPRLPALLAASTAAMTSSINFSTDVKKYGRSTPPRWQWSTR